MDTPLPGRNCSEASVPESMAEARAAIGGKVKSRCRLQLKTAVDAEQAIRDWLTDL